MLLRLTFAFHFVIFQCLITNFALADGLIPNENCFQCPGGSCIPMSWRCDVDNDCDGGEDELNCNAGTTHCSSKEYQCADSIHGRANLPATSKNSRLIFSPAFEAYTANKCIPISWKCDGQFDCEHKDDETDCPEVKCGEDKFECKGFESIQKTCIPKEWVCDEERDCADSSDEDEKHCLNKTRSCAADEFRCNDGQCISSNWRCDGDNDCTDGSDERICVKATCAAVNKFKCETGHCIPMAWHCDKENDCSDNSDEKNCNGTYNPSYHREVNCTDAEFQCKNNLQCIHKLWVCDGEDDCFDFSDEVNCDKRDAKCPTDQVACANGKGCYEKFQLCNGHEECEDGSDEKNCTVSVKVNSCNLETEYLCPNEPQRCIKYETLCKDKMPVNDCTLKSACDKQINLCNSTTDPLCSCRDMGTKGKICTCAEGLRHNGAKCEDINECAQIGICDQICVNTFRSYDCQCHPGYKLTIGNDKAEGFNKNAHKCRATGADPKLLLSNRATIRQYDIITNKYRPLISKLESAVAMDYWHKNQTLIWSDVSKEQIMICHIGQQEVLDSISDCVENGNVTLIDKDIATPDGLAVDWVHGLLFWTDTGLDTISVFDLNTKKRRVLFNDNLDEPRAIAVDPSAGLIFWTDWGNKARIERAGMNGDNRVEIISGETVRWPNGIAVDILDKRIYWADAKSKLISSSDYWGKDLRTILHSHEYVKHPFSLAVFEEKLYWTDWDQEGVLTVNKFRGNDVQTLMKGVTGPMTVRVYHEQAQPVHPDKCELHKCQHLCLPRAHFREAVKERESAQIGLPYSCSCEDGYKIDVDNTHLCVPIHELLPIIIPAEGTTKLSFTYFVFLFMVAIVVCMAVYHYRSNKPSQFSALHFDNPIYRRTVEDLDADLENPTDNSLGAISILPLARNANGNFNSDHQNGDLKKETSDSAKLIISGKNLPNESNHKKMGSEILDVNDKSQYSYDLKH